MYTGNDRYIYIYNGLMLCVCVSQNALLSCSVSVFPRMLCSHALCLCFPECPALMLCVCSLSVILVFLGVGSGVGQQHRRAVLRPSVCAYLQSRLSCLRASGVRLSELLHMDRVSLEEHPSAHLSGGQQRTGGNAAITVKKSTLYNNIDILN